tara:strand:+ start:313 stop:522 length:210 start_codon:yes stop_codon:yes gene_type:complete
MEILFVELPLKKRELSIRSNRSPLAPTTNGVVSALSRSLFDTSDETILEVIGRPNVRVSAATCMMDLPL